MATRRTARSSGRRAEELVTSIPEIRPVPTATAAAAVKRLPLEWPLVVVLFASAAWFVTIGALALRLHREFSTGRFDLGNMTQAVWSTAHGNLLGMTMAGGEQMSRLAVHVDPILVLFTPFAYGGALPEALVLGQALVVACGAYPVYKLGLRYLDSPKAAMLCALAYLLNPWIAWQALFDFHAVVLAIPLLLFAIVFLEQERWVPFALVTALALLTHELVGLSVAALGIWYALRRGRRIQGAIVAGAGLAWTIACLRLIIPSFSSGNHSPFYGHFEAVGGSPGGLAKTALTDPLTILSQATSFRDLAYLCVLLLPVAGLAIWAPTMLLVAGPQLGVNLLAEPVAMTSPTFQYSAAVMPFLFAATVMGLARLKGDLRRLLGASLVASFALLVFVAAGPVNGAPAIAGDSRTDNKPTRSHLADMRIAASLIPANARVSATNLLGAHLSERRVIYSVPVLLDANWVAINRRDSFVPEIPGRIAEGRRPGVIRRFQARIEADPSWQRVFGRDGVFVYRKLA
jgi:uncharacterized membrane protein